jgi:hypothetical protein
MSFVINFLSANFPFANEFQAFWMALQGCVAVRNGPNKDGKMNWFHAFCHGVVLSYAGALFTPFWMGRPTSMFSSDINMAMCIITFTIVNLLPFGYQLSNSFPVRLATTMGAQLFRTTGIIKFVSIAYEAFKDAPSPYYPIPVFGPILNGTILGNMGFFFWKGFAGHLESGIPFPFQNGLLWTTLYHFVAHDHKGFIGSSFRSFISLIPDNLKIGLSDKDLVLICMSLFMQVTAILQMPEFYGPTFNPFHSLHRLVKPKYPKVTKITTTTSNNEIKQKKTNKRKQKKS